MTHVVTENCIQCKYGTCLTVCPVLCFHEGPNFLVINPDECVDCGLCVEACEAQAIYSKDETPIGQELFWKINEKYCKLWPVVSELNNPLNEPDSWNGVKGKLNLLVELK